MTGSSWEKPHTCQTAACMRHPRLACVRLFRSAVDTVIARRSQTSQDDVYATPGKLKEKPQSLWEARLCATRQSGRASGSGSRLALQFGKNETGTAHTLEPDAAGGNPPSRAAARSRGPRRPLRPHPFGG